VIPPRVSQEAIERVQELSVAAFRATECEGMARADCFVRDDGVPVLFGVYVRPAARGQGVLDALVDRVQAWAHPEPLRGG